MTMFDFSKMQEASFVTKTKGVPFEIVDARTPEKFNAKGELKGNCFPIIFFCFFK